MAFLDTEMQFLLKVKYDQYTKNVISQQTESTDL